MYSVPEGPRRGQISAHGNRPAPHSMDRVVFHIASRALLAFHGSIALTYEHSKREDLKIRHMTVDETDDDSCHHLLVNGRHFKCIYRISIARGTHDVDDLCFLPGRLSKLPQLPPGDGNLGHISVSAETASPCFDWTVRTIFSSIATRWHPADVTTSISSR